MIKILKTQSDIRFGICPKRPKAPTPTLFIISATIEESLGEPYSRQCGNDLAKKGYLCASMDLPCHGKGKRPDEPEGLSGWRHRLEKSEPFIEQFNEKMTQVLDYLITNGYTDPNRVAVCGTSRGGFIALHFAAQDGRVGALAAFAPVASLATLREFKGLEHQPAVIALDLAELADKLIARPVWLVIGDQDDRVDTDRAIAFARKVSGVSKEKTRIELHVMPEPRGHTTPSGAPEQAAIWIEKQLNY
ncbi:MAG: prolyl oligopeptidase family serine peptidase [Sedimentisphaerales bacterium]|nr:prolyl oligopeptidase family serine peptidase [Sedimentisphaerales bacterium]